MSIPNIWENKKCFKPPTSCWSAEGRSRGTESRKFMIWECVQVWRIGKGRFEKYWDIICEPDHSWSMLPDPNAIQIRLNLFVEQGNPCTWLPTLRSHLDPCFNLNSSWSEPSASWRHQKPRGSSIAKWLPAWCHSSIAKLAQIISSGSKLCFMVIV